MLKKALVALILICIVGVWVFIPFPRLITYERSNVVSTGVYWRGFGESGQLLDAQASYVKIDDDTDHLHVCYKFENLDSCQQYQILQSKGLLSVVMHLL